MLVGRASKNPIFALFVPLSVDSAVFNTLMKSVTRK